MVYKKYNMKSGGIVSQIELEEIIQPSFPLVKTFFTIKDGRIFDGDKEFRSWGINMVSYAVTKSLPQRQEEFLDQCVVSGINMIRVLHWAIDSTGNYCPTYAEAEAQLPKLDAFIELCSKRGIRVWLTCLERRRLTDSEVLVMDVAKELSGPRPSGIYKNEIHDLIFFSPDVRKKVKDEAVKFISRYKDNPTVAIITLWKEQAAARTKGYFVGDRTGLDTNPYKKLWFQAWDKFNIFGLKGNKIDLAKFTASVGYNTAVEVRDAVRAAGFKGLLNVSEIFGDCPMNCLLEQLAGQIINFHIYHDNDTQIDPLSPITDKSNYRTFDSVTAALHVVGMPIVCTEWASVYQGGTYKLTKSPSWYPAVSNIAQSSADQQLSLAFQYAAYSHPIDNTMTYNNESYDSFKDSNFITEFNVSKPKFDKVNLSPVVLKTLTEADIVGSGIGTLYSVPIPGTQIWAREAAFNKTPLCVIIPKIIELPFT